MLMDLIIRNKEMIKFFRQIFKMVISINMAVKKSLILKMFRMFKFLKIGSVCSMYDLKVINRTIFF